MGEVHLAEDLRLHRRVALKVLPEDATSDRERLHRFRQEARAASALNHPNIVTIYEIDEKDGRHYIAQELVEGRTLRQILSSGALTLDQALDVAIGVASALVAAHEAGVVHRDIKPENVMIRTDGLVKVLDFGLAKLTVPVRESAPEDREARFSTEPGSVMGTVNYMSPEQILTFEVDGRSDVFSLGVLIHEMLTGAAPFDRSTRGDTVRAVLSDDPPSLAGNLPESASSLDEIVRRAMAKERKDRYPTARAFLQELLALRRDLAFERQQKGLPDVQSPLVSLAPASTGTFSARSSDRVRQSVFGLVSLFRRRRRSVLAAGIAILVIIGSVQYLAGRPRPIETIAVIPFGFPVGDSGAEYLSHGLSEETTHRLAQISDLRVLALSTMEIYRGSKLSAIEIGRELGVDAVTTGTVFPQQGRLRVRVEVVDVRQGTRLWGNNYEAESSNLFLIQEEISRDISDKLRIRLTGEEERRVSKRYTGNPEAYDEYLRGRFVWTRDGHRNCDEVIQHYRNAIELDPEFALAYAGMADCYNMMGSYSEMPPSGAFPAAREFAEKALSLDESLAAAHIALAYTLQNYDWNWTEADRRYRRGFELEPSHATGRYWYGGFLMLVERFDDAIRERRMAHELDPLSIVFRTGQGTPYLHARDYNAAITRYKRAIRIDPTFAQAHRSLAWAYLFKGGLIEEALEEIGIALSLSNEDPMSSTLLAYASAAAGNEEQARAILKRIEEDSRSYVSPYDVATVHVALGEYEEALDRIEEAIRQRSSRVTAMKVDPALDPLRDDPRFRRLLARTGLDRTSSIRSSLEPRR
jgi:eukaryotic-like serine/threonine-protein kinase